MSIFSRFGEIINSNINAMLDKAENPEKMVKLMIHEMEDTLTEIKSAAAEVVADRIKLNRTIEAEQARADDWARKADLALAKNREDLAREALEQKLERTRRIQTLQKQLDEVEGLVQQYQQDIARLEEKLQSARDRQNLLIANHRGAVNRKRVEEKIYRLNTTGAFAKFDSYEHRIDRFQAEAQVLTVSNNALEKKFEDLAHEEEIDEELRRLKARHNGSGLPGDPAAQVLDNQLEEEVVS
jgi:phage shock protein A